jgi:hypothetical protein
MREIVASTRDDPQLRRSLPMGVDLGDPSVLVAEFNATLAALRAYLDSAEPTGAAAAIAGDLRELTRPEPLAPLAVLTAAAALGPDTRLRLRRGLRAAVEADGDSVSIKLIDTCVRFPIAADPALKVVLDGREFTPAQLPSLEPDEQLVIARRLLREGIVVSIAASA